MDKIDRKILNIMQRDASLTNVDMAAEVGLSPSTCLRRVQRIHRSGLIEKIVAILNPSKANHVIKALITVELKIHDDQQMRRFLRKASSVKAVSHAYSVTGEIDVVLMIRTRDMEELTTISDKLFSEQNNVARYFTMIIRRTEKEETAIPL